MKRQISVGEGVVAGWCDARFEPLLQVFLENFTTRGEIGASMAILQGEEVVVDLYGGHVDREKTTPWQPNTISVVHSCTKAATALCLHLLIDQGYLSLHEPVAKYWPEYAQAGKGDTTLAMLLNHTSGLPALTEPVAADGFLDWDYMTRLLAAALPWWEPGTAHGYQMTTFGWLVGEVIRRVSGQSLGEFFKANVAEPLGADFWIGLPTSEHPRVARLQRFRPDKRLAPAAFTRRLIADPNSLPAKAYFNTGGFKADSPASYQAEFGAGGGLTNGLGLAKMYAPLANEGWWKGRQLISQQQISWMSETAVRGGEDRTLIMPTHFTLGFMKTMDNRYRAGGALESLRLGSHAFGHAGAGGSVGFADPELGISMGYVMNQMGPGILLNERSQRLVDATYACLGFDETVFGDFRKPRS